MQNDSGASNFSDSLINQAQMNQNQQPNFGMQQQQQQQLQQQPINEQLQMQQPV